MLSPFSCLDSLPLTMESYFPKPLNYSPDCDILIISTNAFETNPLNNYCPGVYKYDINKNEIHHSRSYIDYGAKLHSHGHFIDNKNCILYMFAGLYNQFIQCRLKEYVITNNNIKNHDDITLIANCGLLPCTISVSSPLFNYVYIAGDRGIHFKFNIFKQEFISFKVDRLMNNILHPKLIYIAYTKQLMIVGGDNHDRIWISDIKKKINQTQFKWKSYDKLKMPHKVNLDINYDILLFGDILFVFYFQRKDYKDIFCLDLLHKKWFQSKYNIPKNIAKGSYLILSNIEKNKGYLLDFKTANRYKVNLHNLVPKEMMDSRTKYYKLLIMAWMNQQEKKMSLSYKIPLQIIEIICQYFPSLPVF